MLALEEPAPLSVYSGISNVRGWAVAPQGVQKVELYMDGALTGNLPLGGQRTDVGSAYPNYPGVAQSGFAMAFNYSNLAAGSHTFVVRAYDTTGGARDASATFTVTRFANPYMADPAAVTMDNATISRGGNTLTIQNLLAEGQPYTVQLNWRPATQGFAITQINPAGSSSTSDFSTLPQAPFDRTAPAQSPGCSDCVITPAAAGESIVVTLEEPAPGSVYSGISNVRGWAVAPQGLQKVELYMDGALTGNLPLGGERADVGSAYPNYPGAAQSGFAMALNYSNLAAGSHTFVVRAYDATGGARDASATFAVTRFTNPYMADPAAVNMDNATISRGGNAITVQNLLAEGQPYNIRLDWRPAAQGFAIAQIDLAGSSCTYAITPQSKQFSAQDGSGEVAVSTQNGCSWTAQSNVNWIAIALGNNGTGSGTVKYLVQSNSGFASRTGTLTIAGQQFAVSQSPPDSGSCTYAITPQTKQFSAQDGSGEVAVSTQNGCSWTAQSNENWIAIASGNSGSGPGTVKYLVSSNSGVASRTGTLTIAGQQFTVSQSPPDSGGGGGQ